MKILVPSLSKKEKYRKIVRCRFFIFDSILILKPYFYYISQSVTYGFSIPSYNKISSFLIGKDEKSLLLNLVMQITNWLERKYRCKVCDILVPCENFSKKQLEICIHIFKRTFKTIFPLSF